MTNGAARPVRASKFGGSGSILKRVYRNIALDFQSFQELWVGLKRQTRLREHLLDFQSSARLSVKPPRGLLLFSVLSVRLYKNSNSLLRLIVVYRHNSDRGK